MFTSLDGTEKGWGVVGCCGSVQFGCVGDGRSLLMDVS